ncbi:hypothetical protein Tco_0747839 [Tanacetum coccineum]|uniref:Uncharacterized protein n=1 Tax=Tanacetum coccineum TaxID=301880 RepID=A0ABQ4YTU2_9ASTR
MVAYAFNIKNSMSMLVQKSQDHKKAKDHKMMIRGYAWLMISKKFKIHIQVKPIRTSTSLKSMITTTYHKLKHSVLNANSELICATCHECMFDAIHDLCVSDYLNDVHARVKSKSVKSRSTKSKKKKM